MKNRPLAILDPNKVGWFLGPDSARKTTSRCTSTMRFVSLLNYLSENKSDSPRAEGT